MDTYKIAHFGTFDASQLDLEIIAIYNNDLEALKKLLGKRINKIIKINGAYPEPFTPLEAALYLNKKDIIKYLFDNNASHKGKFHPKPIEIAVRCCDAEKVRMFQNDLESLDEEKKAELLKTAFWGDHTAENIDALESLGITISKYGGLMLRYAAFNNDIETVRLFLEKGADINYHKADSVFNDTSTSILEAVRCSNLEIVRLLVEHGADTNIKNKCGERPYSLAVKNGNREIIEFLAKYESEDSHNKDSYNMESKNVALQKYNLPNSMVEFLKGDKLKIKFTNDKYCKFIRFYPYLDTVETKWKRKKVLSLVAEVDNYSIVDIVWQPDKQMICAIDEEHSTFTPLASWEEFYVNMERYILAYLNGEYE